MPKHEKKKSLIDLCLVQEKEILVDTCKECGNPFELDYRNNEYCVEVNGGAYYLHSSCAEKFANRLLDLVEPSWTKHFRENKK